MWIRRIESCRGNFYYFIGLFQLVEHFKKAWKKSTIYKHRKEFTRNTKRVGISKARANKWAITSLTVQNQFYCCQFRHLLWHNLCLRLQAEVIAIEFWLDFEEAVPRKSKNAIFPPTKPTEKREISHTSQQVVPPEYHACNKFEQLSVNHLWTMIFGLWHNIYFTNWRLRWCLKQNFTMQLMHPQGKLICKYLRYLNTQIYYYSILPNLSSSNSNNTVIAAKK